MDDKFTEKVKSWLETEADKRSYADGAMMLLQLTRNRIFFNNVAPNPNAYAKEIERELRRQYMARLARATHEQVTLMTKQVSVIADKYPSIKEPKGGAKKKAKAEVVAGKRTDHDSLPEEAIAAYMENLTILHKMRELHLKLRTLSTDAMHCPDSERYPFLKELISLDKKMGANWKLYDEAVPVDMAAGEGTRMRSEA